MNFLKIMIVMILVQSNLLAIESTNKVTKKIIETKEKSNFFNTLTRKSLNKNEIQISGAEVNVDNDQESGYSTPVSDKSVEEPLVNAFANDEES